MFLAIRNARSFTTMSAEENPNFWLEEKPCREKSAKQKSDKVRGASLDGKSDSWEGESDDGECGFD